MSLVPVLVNLGHPVTVHGLAVTLKQNSVFFQNNKPLV